MSSIPGIGDLLKTSDVSVGPTMVDERGTLESSRSASVPVSDNDVAVLAPTLTSAALVAPLSVEAASGGILAKNDERYQKYFKMLHLVWPLASFVIHMCATRKYSFLCTCAGCAYLRSETKDANGGRRSFNCRVSGYFDI